MLSSVFLFFSFSGSEIMLILFVALILFGGDKFPEIARGLGRGIREFKDMSDGVKREIHSQINNYDLDPNRSNTTSSSAPAPQITQDIETPHTPADQPYDTVSDYHPAHEASVAPQHEHTPAQVANLENVPQTDAPKAEIPKAFDPNMPPPNTMPHQSY